jgi:2-(1,2-epoxy-1,2-dihydrophenyl)acetyl-CoA isomerase
MHQELRDVLDRLRNSKLVILTGAGDSFCVGDDRGELDASNGAVVDLGSMVEARWNPLIRQIASLPQPVIARVNGIAAGSGASLALACDIVIAAKSASFTQSCSGNYLAPYGGASWMVPRLVGQARALGLALTREPLCAEKAAEWGLIWKAVDDQQLDLEVEALTSRLASLPPLALAGTKRMIRETWEHSLEDALKHETSTTRRLGFCEDYRRLPGITARKQEPQLLHPVDGDA